MIDLPISFKTYRAPRIRPCVYLLLRGGEVVYVGQSVSLPTRIETHRATGKQFDAVRYFEVPDDWKPAKEWKAVTLDTFERALIRFFKGELNVDHMKRQVYRGAELEALKHLGLPAEGLEKDDWAKVRDRWKAGEFAERGV